MTHNILVGKNGLINGQLPVGKNEGMRERRRLRVKNTRLKISWEGGLDEFFAHPKT